VATGGVGGPLGRLKGISTAVMSNAYLCPEPVESAAEDREQLILQHLPQVRLIARRIHDRLPESVSLEDLVSAGILGLIAAIDQYDPSHNVKLKTYAEHKIRGAILDSLRDLDWAPRQRRKKSKQIEFAIARAEQRLHGTPGEDEIAAEIGIELEEYHRWLVEVQGLNLGSLEYTSEDGEQRGLLEYISDTQDLSPAQLLERSQLEKLLSDSIEHMPPMERTVLGLYYMEELSLREIAQVVDLHESRISHLKSQAILRLRAQMSKVWPQTGGMVA
jgi:RNA polymerase sigma factor FliA